MIPRPVDPGAEPELASRLADQPFTFGARAALLRRVASAWVSGSFRGPWAAVVTVPWRPGEPEAFGTEPVRIWELLRRLPDWFCVNCTSELADRLAPILAQGVGQPVRSMDDVYYTLTGPAVPCTSPYVRRLTEEDVALLESSDEPLRPVGFDSLLAAVSGGIVAGATFDGRLVARTSMTLSSEEYADIASYTLEDWRGRGFASAGLSLVATELRSRGLTPVWSTGELNMASRRVAQKIGFHEYGRKRYILFPGLRSSGGFRPPGAEGDRRPAA